MVTQKILRVTNIIFLLFRFDFPRVTKGGGKGSGGPWGEGRGRYMGRDQGGRVFTAFPSYFHFANSATGLKLSYLCLCCIEVPATHWVP